MIDPSYIRTVNIINVVNVPYAYGVFNGQKFDYIYEGLQTNCTGMRPYKGRFPDDIIVGRIDGAKSVLSTFLYSLTNAPIRLIFPKRRLETGRNLGMKLYKLQNPLWENISDNDYSRPVKELNRAIEKIRTDWQIRMVLNFKYTILCILEFDDHYRFIYQDLVGSMDRRCLQKNPRKELKRLLLLASERSHFEGVKAKFKNFSKLVWLIPPKLLKTIVKVLLELDVSKVRLDEDDMDWAEDKPYDFGGVKWKGREYSLQKGQKESIIKTNKMDLPKDQLDAFNKELGALCAKYGVVLQIKSEPQLIVTKKDEPKN